MLQSLALARPHPILNVDNGEIDRFLVEVQMPHLWALDVRSFALPSTLPMLLQLRHLHHVSPWGTTVSGMLSFLRSTPSLERLEVSSSFGLSDNGSKEHPTVKLPKLSFLSCTTSDTEGASVFRFLHYPPFLRVKFLSRFPPSDAATCASDLAPILTRVASSDAAAAVEEIYLVAIMDGVYVHMHVSGHDGLVLDIYFPVEVRELLPLFRLHRSGARTLLSLSNGRRLSTLLFPTLAGTGRNCGGSGFELPSRSNETI